MTSLRALLILFTLFLITACSSTGRNTQSGFLPDYTVLKPSDEYQDTQLYVSSEFGKDALAKIKTLYLPRFEVWVNVKDTDFLNVNPQHIAKLSHYMQSEMVNKLNGHYTVVTEKPTQLDDTVLTIKGAFTDVEFEPIELGVRDFVPIRLVYNAGKSAYLAATEQTEALTHVSLESVFYVGSEKEPMVMMTAHKELDTLVKADGTENVKAVKEILDIWVNNFVTAMVKHRNSGHN
ncbi:DUF3313 family protein [Pseudoalteromonas luteoviolacea]|uniref:DUF3313 family protein n=1 Tax=Pseudoalteromonas luteoviolacea TaxID=43657 RepID=UPI00115346BB|nr:DUF3313 family protein [Pseudoalteromonas luteoviolacea]TQF72350.1 DUF3313 domain-containing protein [Pseudoalteromonas luteoviolacea]